MKMLHEDTSSRFFLFTESRYKTSENPLFLALLIAFRTYIYKSLDKLQRNLKKKFTIGSKQDITVYKKKKWFQRS